MTTGKPRSWEARCAGLALARIGDLGLSPTPSAYGVFYKYFEGEMEGLKREVDDLLTQAGRLTGSTVDDLYAKYCGKQDEIFTVSELAGTVADELSKLLTIVGDAGRNTSDYQTTLETASDKLVNSVNAHDVRDIVTRVLKETESVVAHSRELEQKLVESASTIDNLSNELTNLRREVVTDALTGLANRAEFQRVLTTLMRNAENGDAWFSLLFVDIDHFKRVNDTYGHTIGDKVLRLTASTIAKNVKGKDLAARYGGEEFAVLLCDAALTQAARFAEGLRASVSEQAIVHKSTGERKGNVTVSVGVAEFAAGDTADSLINRADRALYLAKNAGRNRVATESDLTGADASTPALGLAS